MFLQPKKEHWKLWNLKATLFSSRTFQRLKYIPLLPLPLHTCWCMYTNSIQWSYFKLIWYILANNIYRQIIFMILFWSWLQHFGMTGDYLGGEAYCAGGLHLYTPLPFRPGKGGFGDLFRTHFFLNAGNLCNLNYGRHILVSHFRVVTKVLPYWFLFLHLKLRFYNVVTIKYRANNIVQSFIPELSLCFWCSNILYWRSLFIVLLFFSFFYILICVQVKVPKPI